MTAFGVKSVIGRTNIKRRTGRLAVSLFGLAVLGVMVLPASPAHAQGQFIQCIDPGQPLLRIPEIVSQNGKLRGVITLRTVANRMNLGATGSQCVPQFMRAFRAPHGTRASFPAQTRTACCANAIA